MLRGRRRNQSVFITTADVVVAAPARVLIIADQAAACRELERAFPEEMSARSVRSASETEGLGAEIVVIGGPFPIAEIAEVRAHPTLLDKPIVLFAPHRELPPMDWRSMRVWPVLSAHGAIGQLVELVAHLLMPEDASPEPPQQ